MRLSRHPVLGALLGAPLVWTSSLAEGILSQVCGLVYRALLSYFMVICLAIELDDVSVCERNWYGATF